MENQDIVTLSLSSDVIAKMRLFYADDIGESPSQYVDFIAHAPEVTVTAYLKEKNGLRKVVFQGKNALRESTIWGTSEEPAKPVSKKPAQTGYVPFEQIGSDEVGTGDFFGPVIVVACHVTKADIPFLKQLGVTDSKALSDEQIRAIAPQLLQRLDYSQLCLGNEKFNEVIHSGNNMNAIKAKMHNRCLLNVYARHGKAVVYQDQFAEPKTYFSYLSDEPEVLRNITFATKGETKFLSVAAASVIARYSFLIHMDALNDRYQVNFPYGASSKVDEFAKDFVAKFGLPEMEKVAKTNFSNMKRVLE